MTITLRLLTPADEPFLWEMLYYALYVPEGQPPFPPEIVHEPALRRYVAGWGRAGDLGVGAWDEDRPVGAAMIGAAIIGAAWIRLLAGQNKGYGYVNDSIPELSIAIRPGRRGQGIGSRLMERLFEEARTCYPAVSLSVTAENPARRLYARFGFATVAEAGSSLTMVKTFGREDSHRSGQKSNASPGSIT